MKRAVRCAIWLGVAAGLLLAAPLPGSARTYTYKVKHLHTVGGCQGQLIVGETDVRYETDQRDDARIWVYSQIKEVKRQSSTRLTLYTYEDQTLQLGRDRPFDFDFLDGSITDELFNFIVTRLTRRAEPGAAEPPGGRYELAAKHTHTFGGCQGTLKITDTHIEYVTKHSRDHRLWKYLDIKRLDQPSTYRLDIYTYEDQTMQLGRDKVFHFELKEPLEPPVLDYIRRHLGAGATP